MQERLQRTLQKFEDRAVRLLQFPHTTAPQLADTVQVYNSIRCYDLTHLPYKMAVETTVDKIAILSTVNLYQHTISNRAQNMESSLLFSLLPVEQRDRRKKAKNKQHVLLNTGLSISM